MTLKKPIRITLKILINIVSFYAVAFLINYGFTAMYAGKTQGWILFPTMVIGGFGALILNCFIWKKT